MALTSSPSELLSQNPKIELLFSARGLQKLDLLSHTDAFAIVSLAYEDGKNEELGRTEVVYDNEDPDFVKPIILDYFFEELQSITVILYDEDSKSSTNLSDHDYVGEVSFTLSGLMSARGASLNLPLTRQGRAGDYGQLIVRGEEIAECNDTLTVQFRAENLLNRSGFFGTSDPFFKLLRSREDGSWVPIFSSSAIKNNLSPTWDRYTMNVQTVCNGDYERPLKFEVWDNRKNGKHIFMGAFQTSVNQLSENAGSAKGFFLFEEDKNGKQKSTPSGIIKVLCAEVRRLHSFLDFIRGGCEINMVVAIDFTASNGRPSNFDSLHHIDRSGMKLNAYEQVITSVGQIIREYDTDKRFPVFGFGAKLPTGISHCFPLHGPEGSVYEIDGIMNSYRNAINRVELSGPTLFSPVITQVMRSITGAFTQDSQLFTILLIITDGVINDMSQTVDTIVEASHLPLSIIIVGVGNADFKLMNDLDSDDALLVSSRGQKAVSDIVQFVPFRDYSTQHFSRLARDTLIEVPRQLLTYCEINRIRPNPPLGQSFMNFSK